MTDSRFDQWLQFIGGIEVLLILLGLAVAWLVIKLIMWTRRAGRVHYQIRGRNPGPWTRRRSPQDRFGSAPEGTSTDPPETSANVDRTTVAPPSVAPAPAATQARDTPSPGAPAPSEPRFSRTTQEDDAEATDLWADSLGDAVTDSAPPASSPRHRGGFAKRKRVGLGDTDAAPFRTERAAPSVTDDLVQRRGASLRSTTPGDAVDAISPMEADPQDSTAVVDTVDCSIFAPPEVEPDREFLI